MSQVITRKIRTGTGNELDFVPVTVRSTKMAIGKYRLSLTT